MPKASRELHGRKEWSATVTVLAVVVALACGDDTTPPVGQAPELAFYADPVANDDVYDDEVWVIAADGTGLRNLTNNVAGDFLADWSPDGRKLVFVSDRDGDYDIYVMNDDGGNVINLTSSEAWESAPLWSPDGSRIAFQSDRDHPTSRAEYFWPPLDSIDVFVMNADGSNVVNVSANPLRNDEHVAWSADGTQLAFARGYDGGAELATVARDGSGIRNVTTDKGGYIRGPQWSLDGTRILFERSNNCASLFSISVTGTGIKDLAPARCYTTGARWSPNGLRLVYSAIDSAPLRIWVANADGSGATRLTHGLPSDINPEWSPDGSLIAFQREQAVDHAAIMVMKSNGTGVRNLTPNFVYAGYVRWRPVAR